MKTVERRIIQLRAPLDFVAVQADQQRRCSISAYTGAIIDSRWGSFVIDISGIQTKEKVPILREHEPARIVGFCDQTERKTSELSMEGAFSSATTDAQEVLALADEGFPWQASIGVRPLQVKLLKNQDEKASVNGREIAGPMEIWSKSFVGEVSLTPWGLDRETGMQLLSEDGSAVQVQIDEPYQTEGVSIMNLAELKEKFPAIYQEVLSEGAASVDVAKFSADAKAAGISEERARVTTILSVAEADQAAKERAISEGLSAEASYKLFFEAETTRRKEKLAKLETQKPPSAGASGKPKETPAGDGFMSAVMKRMSETKCSKASAIKAIADENPELHQAYLDGLAKK